MERKSKGKNESVQKDSYAVRFSLSFLANDLSEKLDMPPYDYELLTAEEKADYFAYLSENGGKENVFKIAKDCEHRATSLRRKASRLDKDSARPLIDHANRLECHARSIRDVVPDVRRSYTRIERETKRKALDKMPDVLG